MNVLLVSAATPETFWSFKHLMTLVSKKAAFPPLGLMTVAAMLPEQWKCRLVDLNVASLKEADVEWADYVMLSAMLVQADSALDVIARCNKAGRTIIAGGPLFTTGYARFPQVDHFVIGEAEGIITDLVADMESGHLSRFYKSGEWPDIAQTPPPRWDLIDMKHYLLMPLQFSRGCPFDCEFCDIAMLNGRRPRTKTPDQMIRELDQLVDAGWNGSVFVVDDNFIGNKTKVKTFLRELITWREARRLRFAMITEASLNLVDDPELLELMPAAGFKSIFVGIETPSEEGLLECAKIQNTRRDLVAAVRRIQNSGMEVMGGFIVGFDSDQPNIFERQMSFIQESGIATAMVGMLGALPGTRLFSRLKEEGRLLGVGSGDNVAGILNFVPKLDANALVEGYRSMVRHIYSPREYYARIMRFLQEYRPHARRPHLSWEDLKAWFKSLWLLGVRTQHPWHYWKFVAGVLLRHRRSFPEAMTLAIMGHHFRKVAAAI